MSSNDIVLNVDMDRITLNDLIMLEGGTDAKSLKVLLGRFVVDKEGKYIDEDEASELAGKLTLTQIRAASEQIREAMGGFEEEAFPSPPKES